MSDHDQPTHNRGSQTFSEKNSHQGKDETEEEEEIRPQKEEEEEEKEALRNSNAFKHVDDGFRPMIYESYHDNGSCYRIENAKYEDLHMSLSEQNRLEIELRTLTCILNVG